MNNFIFIGGPHKCATSSLFDFLSNSSGITPSNIKETFYFIDKSYPLISDYNYHKYGWQGFDKFFTKDQGLKLEATTHLIFQKDIIKDLAETKNSVFVFIYRDPAERIFSSFNFTKYYLGNFKSDLSFKRYVEFLMSNNQDELDNYMYDTNSRYVLKNELNFSKYYSHIKRWIDQVGQDRVLVLDFNALISNPNEIIKEINKKFGFEIKPGIMTMNKKNESFEIRNTVLHKKILTLKKKMPFLGKARILKTLYFNFQKKQNQNSDKDPVAIKTLRDYFNSDTQKLRELLSYHWS